MDTIIIISKDPHVLLLQERFQPLVKGQILIFPDYEQGLMAVFDKRPASVFMQREIDGTTANVIAKQIKGLLRDSSPHIVLMGALDGTDKEGTHCFDDSFDFASSDEELCSFFADQLSKIPNFLWKDRQGVADLVTSDADSHPTPTELFHMARSGSHHSGEKVSVEAPDILPSAASDRDSPAAAKPGRTVPGEEFKLFVNEAVAKQSTAVSTEDDLTSIGLIEEKKPLLQKSRIYIAALFVLAGIGALAYFTGMIPSMDREAKDAVSSVRKEPAQHPAPAPVRKETVQNPRITSLPGVVPVNGKDTTYSASHPGWERYTSGKFEFLVFRSVNVVKALQVMASGAADIPDNMISDILEHYFGTGSYEISGSTISNGYTVQQAILSDGAELAIYRKKSDDLIRGVVVTFP